MLGQPGPFISNAEAATPTLRLLMWQPYAIKETIAAFESQFKAKFAPTFFDGNSEAFNKLKVGGTKDFDMVMADGFWPRLYFRQGLTKARRLLARSPTSAACFPTSCPTSFKLLADEERREQRRRAQLLGRLRHHRQHHRDRQGGHRLDRAAAEQKYAGHLSTNSRFEENIALMGILAATKLGTMDGAAARTASRSIPISSPTTSWPRPSAC